MVKSLPANAGDLGSIPGLGRFPVPRGNKVHVPHLLSPRALSLRSRAERAPQGEARAATRESLSAAAETSAAKDQ